MSWTTRLEEPADIPAIHAVTAAAFPTEDEALLVDALREDPEAWVDLSVVTLDEDDQVVGHALLTRCTVGGEPALALAPCSVLPDRQRTGAGAAAIDTALATARERGENLVVVLGHADYYPRFGFSPASEIGVTAPFEVPDEAFLTLILDPELSVPSGVVHYPAAFGV